MRVFKTKVFVRFARKARLDDAALRKAVADAERGLIDADLGGGLIKQRVGREGGGKSSGFRVLLLFRLRDRAVFLDGFAKNERDNIDAVDLRELKRLAAEMLAYDEAVIAMVLASGALTEVEGYGEAL